MTRKTPFLEKYVKAVQHHPVYPPETPENYGIDRDEVQNSKPFHVKYIAGSDSPETGNMACMGSLKQITGSNEQWLNNSVKIVTIKTPSVVTYQHSCRVGLFGQVAAAAVGVEASFGHRDWIRIMLHDRKLYSVDFDGIEIKNHVANHARSLFEAAQCHGGGDKVMISVITQVATGEVNLVASDNKAVVVGASIGRSGLVLGPGWQKQKLYTEKMTGVLGVNMHCFILREDKATGAIKAYGPCIVQRDEPHQFKHGLSHVRCLGGNSTTSGVFATIHLPELKITPQDTTTATTAACSTSTDVDVATDASVNPGSIPCVISLSSEEVLSALTFDDERTFHLPADAAIFFLGPSLPESSWQYEESSKFFDHPYLRSFFVLTILVALLGFISFNVATEEPAQADDDWYRWFEVVENLVEG